MKAGLVAPKPFDTPPHLAKTVIKWLEIEI